MGGTCDQETGQCECLEGVIGQNCDHCPDNWVLVVNETRTVTPEWKRPFSYREGCFPCSSCVADLMVNTNGYVSLVCNVCVPVSAFLRMAISSQCYGGMKLVNMKLQVSVGMNMNMTKIDCD